MIVGDVYVYPSDGRTAEAELDLRWSREIKPLHADARLLSRGAVAIRPSGSPKRGMRATFAFSENFRPDIPGPYKGQVLIFRQGDRFVKYRFSYTRSTAARAEQEIDAFLSALRWPD